MHQVPVERQARTALRLATGTNTISALVREDGTSLIGEKAIRRFLDDHIAELAEAEATTEGANARAAATWRRNADACNRLHPE